MLIATTTGPAEERARGSLDVLLATPLSSRRIVLSTWWSVFRQWPLLLPLTVLVAAVLAGTRGTGRSSACSSCSCWPPGEPAVSAWHLDLDRGMSRAVTAAVILYTLVGLGWPMMALTLFNPNGPGTGLSAVSPFYGLFDLTITIESPHDSRGFFAWAVGWTIVYVRGAVTCGMIGETGFLYTIGDWVILEWT